MLRCWGGDVRSLQTGRGMWLSLQDVQLGRQTPAVLHQINPHRHWWLLASMQADLEDPLDARPCLCRWMRLFWMRRSSGTS